MNQGRRRRQVYERTSDHFFPEGYIVDTTCFPGSDVLDSTLPVDSNFNTRLTLHKTPLERDVAAGRAAATSSHGVTAALDPNLDVLRVIESDRNRATLSDRSRRPGARACRKRGLASAFMDELHATRKPCGFKTGNELRRDAAAQYSDVPQDPPQWEGGDQRPIDLLPPEGFAVYNSLVERIPLQRPYSQPTLEPLQEESFSRVRSASADDEADHGWPDMAATHYVRPQDAVTFVFLN